ncbi:hypothetical protein JOB18_044387 [Solea senegalensis]|uniref:Uncharacterized protein n=1 Tax=Solea senegalensis TaxID=28829 RepID=A0AAV6QXH3_SOLSE|nr:hypothetical protein JOB18_044387 [Solea senegalensis]
MSSQDAEKSKEPTKHAKQPALTVTPVHKSQRRGRAPWLVSELEKPLELVLRSRRAHRATSDGSRGLERAPLNLSDQFGLAEPACVSSAANLVSSLQDHDWRLLLLFDWLKWAPVSLQQPPARFALTLHQDLPVCFGNHPKSPALPRRLVLADWIPTDADASNAVSSPFGVQLKINRITYTEPGTLPTAPFSAFLFETCLSRVTAEIGQFTRNAINSVTVCHR